MAKSILEELVTVLGFEIDADGIEKFNKLTDEAVKGLKSVAKRGAIAATAFSAYVTVVNHAVDAQFKFAKTLGLSLDAVQKLAFAGDIWGASMEDVHGTLAALEVTASAAAREGNATLGFLGISPTANGEIKDSLTLFKEIADRIQGMSEGRQLDLTGQLGISPNMLLLMRKGSAEINRLGNELDEIGFLVSKEQAEQAEAFVDATIRAKAAVFGLGQQIAVRFAPGFTKIVDKMLVWVKANKELIDTKLDSWFKKAEKFARPLGISLLIMAAALAVMVISAFAVEAAIVLAIAAIGLMIDDFMRWTVDPENTLIGRIIGSPADVMDAAEKAWDAIKNSHIGKLISEDIDHAGRIAGGIRDILMAPVPGSGVLIDAVQGRGTAGNVVHNTFNIFGELGKIREIINEAVGLPQTVDNPSRS